MTMTSPPSGLCPQLDFSVSKLTGLTRAHWVASADEQLLAVRSFAVTGGIALPGPTSCSGVRCDRLEGVARTFLLAAFRAGEGKDVDPFGHLRFYCQLISEGARSAHDGSWPRAYENRQVVVEGASIALSLLLTRNTVWSWVSESVRRDIFLWLDEAIWVEIPDNNWVLFRAAIAEFLLQMECPLRAQEVYLSITDAALARINDWYVSDGWYRDGNGQNFDYYNAWALHLYPALLVILTSESRPSWSLSLRNRVAPRLTKFLRQHMLFFGSTGRRFFTGVL